MFAFMSAFCGHYILCLLGAKMFHKHNARRRFHDAHSKEHERIEKSPALRVDFFIIHSKERYVKTGKTGA
jgi:hypothetical protein